MFRTGPVWLRGPTDSLRYAVYCRLFAAASAVHLTLPDALDDRWWPAHLLHWPGALLVAINGSLAGWALCAAGLLLPLLFYEDQLTQSVYLLGCAAGALACWAGRAKGRDRRMARAFPAVVRVLTVGTYALAALHKVNRDFFDPEVSCATGGLEILAENWAVPWLADPALEAVWPHAFLMAELLVVALLVARPAAGMVLALLMHIPLTIVFAPSFAFVMISGWACLLQEHEIAHLGRTMRRRWKLIVPLGMGIGALSFWAYMRTHWVVYPFWSFKEALLWTGVVWMIFAWVGRPAGVFRWWSAWREKIPRGRRWVVVAAVAVWLANGLTPYAGLQFHHTGAMLSNLRVDEGCWNSYLFPESMRLVDPYVRIDQARTGEVPGERALVTLIEERLWSPSALLEERRGWCEAGAAPLHVEGTYRGRRFVVEDLCAPGELPFEEPALPGFRAYQVNLARHCPQACIH